MLESNRSRYGICRKGSGVFEGLGFGGDHDMPGSPLANFDDRAPRPYCSIGERLVYTVRGLKRNVQLRGHLDCCRHANLVSSYDIAS
jgi:hypothetical protein